MVQRRGLGKLAETCKQVLVKGQQVYIEGRLQTRRWEDQEGRKHSSIEIVAESMIMLGERRAGHAGEGAPPLVETSAGDEEFPF